ncbi:hypothetical protein BAE44_0008571 [Dichanthelium oligosanthes]|uniref:Uncharacterized protein n=1 Tax=Dichanthelium oligosanthes TaxID=888268 RepID=A0A1E5VZ53_9POAL|nr:hypothetical protein BAE44_0008571 [Dichanthelium oligosanthes]
MAGAQGRPSLDRGYPRRQPPGQRRCPPPLLPALQTEGPTIRAHVEVGLVGRRCLARYDLSPGDVVIFRPPTEHPVLMVQMLIALPGSWRSRRSGRCGRSPRGTAGWKGTMVAAAGTRDSLAL